MLSTKTEEYPSELLAEEAFDPAKRIQFRLRSVRAREEGESNFPVPFIQVALANSFGVTISSCKRQSMASRMLYVYCSSRCTFREDAGLDILQERNTGIGQSTYSASRCASCLGQSGQTSGRIDICPYCPGRPALKSSTTPGSLNMKLEHES